MKVIKVRAKLQDTVQRVPKDEQVGREAKRFKSVKAPDKCPRRPGIPLPAKLSHPRKNRTYSSMLRSLDDPWLGEEPTYLGMAVWTEEQLAEHAKVSVEQARVWITQGNLPTLPTPDGSVRIAEADFKDWANDDELLIIEMNRFWKRSEVAAAFGIPDDLKYIVKEVPTAHVYAGEEYVLGRDVERVIAEHVATERPDGPHPPDTIRVAGKDYRYGSDRGWRLLKCLWSKAAVTIDRVIEDVYGHNADDREKSLDSLIKHTRTWLRSCKCPLAIRTKAGYVELLRTGGNKGPEGSTANPR